jgi:triosephosphate isomerase
VSSSYPEGGSELQPKRLRPIVGGNWKMNTTLPDAVDLAETLVRLIGEVTDVEVVICPPYPNLEGVHQAIEGSTLRLGAQDVFWEEKGAYTGEVSAPMLGAVGCSWVIVGHSERRRLLGESNQVVNRKLQAALRNGLQAILAVGETREERNAGQTDEVLEHQLGESLAGLNPEDMSRVVIAYEPVWAIGTGDTATPEQAREAHAFVRAMLAQLYGEEIARSTRIQYGGSCTAHNADELLSQPGIDGALVGGASLKAEDFAAIVRAARSG